MKKISMLVIALSLLPMASHANYSVCAEVGNTANKVMELRQYSGQPRETFSCDGGKNDLCVAMFDVAYKVPLIDGSQGKADLIEAYGVAWYRQCLKDMPSKV